MYVLSCYQYIWPWCYLFSVRPTDSCYIGHFENMFRTSSVTTPDGFVNNWNVFKALFPSCIQKMLPFGSKLELVLWCLVRTGSVKLQCMCSYIWLVAISPLIECALGLTFEVSVGTWTFENPCLSNVKFGICLYRSSGLWTNSDNRLLHLAFYKKVIVYGISW